MYIQRYGHKGQLRIRRCIQLGRLYFSNIFHLMHIHRLIDTLILERRYYFDNVGSLGNWYLNGMLVDMLLEYIIALQYNLGHLYI